MGVTATVVDRGAIGNVREAGSLPRGVAEREGFEPSREL